MSFIRKVSENIDVNEKIDYHNSFELVTLRWKYFLKSPNPTTEELKDLKPIVEKVSKKLYNRFINVFTTVGYTVEDIISLGNCHAVNYLGVFALEVNEKKRESFIAGYRKRNGEDTYPEPIDFKRKNMYDLSKFLNQRLEEVGKVCFQKNRSIRGTGETFKVFSSNNPIEGTDLNIIESPEKFNYQEITIKKYNEIRKEIKADKGSSFEYKELYIKAISITAKDITVDQYYDFLDNSSEFSRTPEGMLLSLEDKAHTEECVIRFSKFEESEKKKTLRNFININKGNSKLKKELSTARKMLKEI